jgi:hypothetical protein
MPATTQPLVGHECRACLGTGTPEHFSLGQPEGRVTCQPCGGTGQIKGRFTYLPNAGCARPVTPNRPLPEGVACLDCQRFGYATDCPTCGGTSR